MKIGNRLICDCCARQIVSGNRSDKSVTPTLGNDIHIIDINSHCCRERWPSYLEWEKMNEDKNLRFGS